MKKYVWLFTLTLVIAISAKLPCTAYAMGYEDFVKARATSGEKEEFLSSLNLKLITEESKAYPIESFAISEHGQIALGVNSSNDTLIYVYNTDGQFLYGYNLVADVFDVFFDGDAVSIYWGKENYAATFDSDGNCTKFLKTDGYRENSEPQYDGYAKPTSGTVGDIQYEAEYGTGILPQFVRFTITDSDGNRHVIYDVEKEYTSSFLGYVSVFIISISIWMIGYINGKKRKEK